MRAFLGIALPQPACDAVVRLQNRLRRSNAHVSWTPPERLHITLAFLGEIDPETLGSLQRRLSQASGYPAAFPVRVRGVGAFGTPQRLRVVFAALEPRPEWRQLQDVIEPLLRNLDIPVDERPFAPHLTLGRVRSARGHGPLSELVHGLSAKTVADFQASAFDVFESRPTARGPIYRSLESIPLPVASAGARTTRSTEP